MEMVIFLSMKMIHANLCCFLFILKLKKIINISENFFF